MDPQDVTRLHALREGSDEPEVITLAATAPSTTRERCQAGAPLRKRAFFQSPIIAFLVPYYD
jgi:hypothetical protein